MWTDRKKRTSGVLPEASGWEKTVFLPEESPAERSASEGTRERSWEGRSFGGVPAARGNLRPRCRPCIARFACSTPRLLDHPHPPFSSPSALPEPIIRVSTMAGKRQAVAFQCLKPLPKTSVASVWIRKAFGSCSARKSFRSATWRGSSRDITIGRSFPV